ncbi:MAG TPA: mismatch-specific DNA-glycosylase [Gammaproteobacteria bacterium]|nr:mismatch-specific DNA-glycosylase [Gammaproteobacteria bacterium]
MRSNRNPYFSLGHDRPATELPLTLADLHLSLSPEDEVIVHLGARSAPDWSRQRALDLVTGAGFLPRGKVVRKSSGFVLRLKRIRSLPDTVGPNMQVLIIGLNPSPYSADTGIGYGRPGNRFWPAALKAGLVSIDRDPRHALSHHGVGMTDLVRRTTARADEVERTEFEAGFERIERLAAWLKPTVCCFIGLGGWRLVVDRKAVAGRQTDSVGGCPVYVMPHTSGLNAHSRLEDLVKHLAAVFAMAGATKPV